MPIEPPSYVVLIVLDGARPDYFNVPGIPHVRALLRNGTQYSNAWAGILESETPSGHATIASGSQPKHDGILSFDWQTGDNLPVDLFPASAIQAGQMDRVMRQAHATTIASLVHRQRPHAKVVALSGYKYYAADALGGPDADVIMYFAVRGNKTFGPTYVTGHAPPPQVIAGRGLVLPNRNYPLGGGNHLAMTLAVRAFQSMRQQVTLINVPEFDWPLGHVLGANRDGPAVRKLMQSFDRDLGMLEDSYRRAGVLNRTLFVLTADHGFTPIDHKISSDVIERAVKAAGGTIVRAHYHTAAYLWLKDRSKIIPAAAAISHLQNPYIQSVYFKSIGPDGPVYIRASGPDLFKVPGVEGANQYLLNTFDGPNGPDVAVFMRERSMVWQGGEKDWKADHGGAAWESQHLPLVLSGPGVRKGYVSQFPAPLMDVAPTVLSLLGTPHTGMQGTPLADALQHASAADRAAQAAQGGTLSPPAASLKAESNAEVAAGL